MSREAGKAPVKEYIKRLVVISNSFDDYVNKIRATGNKENLKDIEMFKLWNRRSAFKREIEEIDAAAAKKAAAKVEVRKPNGQITELAGNKDGRASAIISEEERLLKDILNETRNLVIVQKEIAGILRGLRRIP